MSFSSLILLCLRVGLFEFIPLAAHWACWIFIFKSLIKSSLSFVFNGDHVCGPFLVPSFINQPEGGCSRKQHQDELRITRVVLHRGDTCEGRGRPGQAKPSGHDIVLTSVQEKRKRGETGYEEPKTRPWEVWPRPTGGSGAMVTCRGPTPARMARLYYSHYAQSVTGGRLEGTRHVLSWSETWYLVALCLVEFLIEKTLVESLVNLPSSMIDVVYDILDKWESILFFKMFQKEDHTVFLPKVLEKFFCLISIV